MRRSGAVRAVCPLTRVRLRAEPLLASTSVCAGEGEERERKAASASVRALLDSNARHEDVYRSIFKAMNMGL